MKLESLKTEDLADGVLIHATNEEETTDLRNSDIYGTLESYRNTELGDSWQVPGIRKQFSR